MKDITKRELVLICISIMLAITSLFIMIGQIRMSKQIDLLLTNASENTTVTVSWYSTDGTTAIIGENITEATQPVGETYIINTNSKKIHSPDCQYAVNMNEENKMVIVTDNLSEYINNGYSICSKCGAGQ